MIVVLALTIFLYSDAPGFAAVVDCYGDLIDSFKLPTICKRQGAIRVNPDDIEKIIALLRDKKPHVVAVAAESRIALDIKEALLRMFGTPLTFYRALFDS